MKAALRFEPTSLAERARFAFVGQRVIARALRELSQIPPDAAPTARQALESRIARDLLDHLRVRLDIQGLENARGGPFLIAALHEGVADVLCLALLPLSSRFVARAEIFDWPRIGAAIRHLGHVSIEPERGATAYRTLYCAAQQCRDRGESLTVFPQGTLLGIETALRPGMFRVAARLGMPILPVAISGTHRIWEYPFSARLRYDVPVSMQVLPPVETRDVDPETLRLRVSALLKTAAFADAGQSPAVVPRRYVPERDGWWDGFAFDIDPRFAALEARVRAHRRKVTLLAIAPN